MRVKTDKPNEGIALEFAILIEKLINQLDKLNQIDEMKIMLENRLEKIEDILYAKNVDDYLDQFIPLERAIKLLGISKRQFYTLRKRGDIDFIKVGKKVFLTRRIINEFMDRHTVKAN
ncbi:MAG: hypothetical protein COA97_02495 [Flavobacteriales bacterium]|nr:MAG: hypothetical protein COA97_02495 [Flavobacteriales bacterium]